MTRWLAVVLLLAVIAGCGGGTGKPKDGGTDRAGDGAACNAGDGGKKANGAACGCAADCAGGHCVDGVCCATACNETCKACDVPGSVGSCTFVPSGVEPHDGACAATATTTCGADGTCDGSGGCRKHPAGTTCKSGRCDNAAVVDINVCDGLGRCRPGPSTVCAPFSCETTSNECTTSCRSDADCVAGIKCVNGSCGPKPRGAVCTKNSECASNFCADGVCCNVSCQGACVSCNQSGRTGTCWPTAGGNLDPHKICRTDTPASCGQTGACDGVGSCALYPAQTTVCVAPSCSGDRVNTAATCDGRGSCGTPGLKSCGPYRCAAGACVSACTNDDDCVSGNSCQNGSCGKKPNGLTCSAASECLSGFCADGICCDGACDGVCRSCKLPASMGTCTAVPAGGDEPHGLCAAQAPSTCGTDGKCDGANACRRFRPGTVCAPEQCSAGVFSPEGTCNATGTCATSPSLACAPFACNGSRCFDACTVDANCAAGEFCTGRSCGLKPIGAFCSIGSECSSSFCAQGVCCTSACGSACKSCALAGSMGLCTNVAKDAPDPSETCTVRAPETCGTNGKCEAGACQRYAPGVSCLDASCPISGTTLTPAGTCDGSGSCVVPAATSCFPFACGAGACKSTCAGDMDCAAPATCGTGSCGLKPVGAICAGPGECRSNFCAQGVCCNTACSTSCRSCVVAGSVGTCSPTPAGDTDLTGACHDEGAMTCGMTGVCDGVGGCQLYDAGTQCAPPACPTGTTGATLARVCDGSGTCRAAMTQSCGSYQCNGTTCNSACGTQADCSGDNLCLDGACGKNRLGQICGAGSECESDNCVDGVCCDAASCGNCLSCNVVGTAGSCQPVPAGDMEPHGGCAANPPCGWNGRCDGLGACENAPTSTSCGTGACTGATFTPVGACDGDGACRQIPTSCAPYLCGGTACLTTCVSDLDCVTGYNCLAGSCTNLLPDSAACTRNTECISGHCTDGYCCPLASCGPCRSCALIGHVGSCMPMPGGMGDTRCPIMPVSTCGTTGVCDGAGQCTRHPAGTTCSAASCGAGLAARSTWACNGAGQCTATPTDCSPYRCDAATATCRTKCSSNGDCAQGTTCDGNPTTPGACTPK